MVTFLVDIQPDDCADLLASTTLGRLAVMVDGHPEVFPVNHVYDRERGCVVFPTNPGTKVHTALGWPWVAFEVDGIDPDGVGVWSVLVVGCAEQVTEPDVVDRLDRERHVPWRAGDRVLWVRIVPSKVTGRRICAGDHGSVLGIN